MRDFIRSHEDRVARALAGLAGAPLRAFRDHHERQIAYLQAERFAHLLVTLAFGLFALGATLALLLHPGLATAALLALLIALLVPYVFHYYRLENAVQRWYALARRIDDRLGDAGEATPGP